MRRYLYSNLLKIIVGSILAFVFLPASLFFAHSLITDKGFNRDSFIIIASCVCLWLLCLLVTFVLNKSAPNSIAFEKGKITYKNKIFYFDCLSIRYFKFYISFIEPSLVIPKIVINGNGLYITCYLSKKDVNKIKKMGYEIKEI